MLNGRVLAYWFMDDGSAHDKKSSKALVLNTHSFSFEETLYLCRVLSKKFKIDCWPRRQNIYSKNSHYSDEKYYYRIYIRGRHFEKIMEHMEVFYIHSSMKYKLPETRLYSLDTTKYSYKILDIVEGRFHRTVKFNSSFQTFTVTETIWDEKSKNKIQERAVDLNQNNFDEYFEKYNIKYKEI